jgi:hypothetical protein
VSLALAGIFQSLAVPFLLASRRQGAPADRANASAETPDQGSAEDLRP